MANRKSPRNMERDVNGKLLDEVKVKWTIKKGKLVMVKE